MRQYLFLGWYENILYFLPLLLGATRSVECMEVMYARQKVVLTAKAFRLQAIDVVHTDYKGEKTVAK